MTTPGSFTERVAKAKSNYKGGQSSHLYDRVIYLKETATALNLNHKDFLERLRADKVECPMGWIRAQLAPGMSQVVTEEMADEIPA